MKISNMIFTDGKIISYKRDEKSLILHFRDNSEKDFEIKFKNVDLVEDFDSIGYSISKSNFKKDKDKQFLELLDDDLSCMFRVTFNDAEITRKTTF